MREVEHFLCEMRKYVRRRDEGVPPRERYRGAEAGQMSLTLA